MNAPQLAEARGLVGARDDVVVRASTSSTSCRCAAAIGDRAVHVAGTLFGKRAAPRIVGIHEHSVDVPPSSHMLVVRNSDTPGDDRQGRHRSSATAGVNIADMDVGTNAVG